MAKHTLGRFLGFAAICGAVAAGISYFTQYKSFKKDLDGDFHDFEEDEEESDEAFAIPSESTVSRNYVPLRPEEKDDKKVEGSTDDASTTITEEDSFKS